MLLNEIRAMYPTGTKIVLKEMAGESQMPAGLKGTVAYVDDIGQIHMEWENGSSLALNIDEDRFEKAEPKKTISVLLVEPGRSPRMIEIEDTLEAKQALVGGCIEQFMPFMDDAALICHEEGKLEGLPLNRAIYDEDGTMIDIVAGTFFLCYAPIDSERFLSLPESLAQKYTEKFKYPEIFYRDRSGIHVLSYKRGDLF